MTQGIWPPVEGPTDVADILGWRPDADRSSLPLTRLLARAGGVPVVTDAAVPPVRDLWVPASAGALTIAFGVLTGLGLALSLLARGLHPVNAGALGAVWGALALAGLRRVLVMTRAHRWRWQHLVAVALAVGIGVAAALPLSTLVRLPAARFDLPTEARLLIALLSAPAAAFLLGLAVLPVAAVTGRRVGRDVRFLPLLAAGTATGAAPTPGPVRRVVLWVGGLRDDLAGRWPVIDRLHDTWAQMVATNALYGGVTAWLAMDAAASGHGGLAVMLGVAWGATSGALARHHSVVRADAAAADERRLAALGVVVAALAGLVTSALVVVGLLLRTALLPLAGVQAPTLASLATGLFGDSMPLTVGALILVGFSLFVHLLPALRWRAGDIPAIQREVVTLFDAVAREASNEEGTARV